MSHRLLYVPCLPDLDLATASARSTGTPKTRMFAELLIDAEEDLHLRAVLLGGCWGAGLRLFSAFGAPGTRPHGEPAAAWTTLRD